MIDILLLVGKTCAGKDMLQRELIKLGMKNVVSYTTRPMRYGEADGIEYHFISESEFRRLKEQGFFAETTEYKVADESTWYYGSAKKDLTDDKVIIVNPEGLREIKKIKELNPVSFYIMADEETLWNRLRQRGDDSVEARRRLNADDEDFKNIDKYIDFAFRNDSGLNPRLLAEMILWTYKKVGNL